MLRNKKITLLISGGIAAYKMVDVVSSLVRLGADVTCVLTQAAESLVSPLALKTMSRNRVYTDRDLFDPTGGYEKVAHIRLAQDTDLVVLAPATADTIARMCCGMAGDLVTAILLATDKPVVVFPAMNEVMYKKQVTQKNICELQSMGIDVVKPEAGRLACGSEGIGRLPGHDAILEYIKYKIYEKKDLSGMKVLINTGGTSEKLDSVRCITNHSSGKMGIALAKEAFYRGAEVVVVFAGKYRPVLPFIKTVHVDSSSEMLGSMKEEFASSDIVVFSAAVSDYIPESPAEGKLKKKDGIDISLKRNIDIALEFSKQKKDDMTFIGFCAETFDLEENAREKMKNKKFDIIFATDLTVADAGFGSENNAGLLIVNSGKVREVPKMSKDDIASLIYDEAFDIKKH